MKKTLQPLALLAVLGLAGCPDGGETGDTTEHTAHTDDTDTNDADLVNGAGVFAGVCANCHGSDGSGNTGPNLNERVPGKTQADIEAIITNGGGYMPAQTAVTGDDLRDVAAYVIDSFGG